MGFWRGVGGEREGAQTGDSVVLSGGRLGDTIKSSARLDQSALSVLSAYRKEKSNGNQDHHRFHFCGSRRQGCRKRRPALLASAAKKLAKPVAEEVEAEYRE